MRLRTSRRLPARARHCLTTGLEALPELSGEPITVLFRPRLTAYSGRLLSGSPRKGTAVHAAAFIRKRRVVLEDALLQRPAKLRLIFVHEVFHFVWARFGNRARNEFSAILRNEFENRARGELGESSGVKKHNFFRRVPESTSREWREYVCESFCDTAAWFYCGRRLSGEATLAARWRNLRSRWICTTFSHRRSY